MKWTPELILQRCKSNPYMANEPGFIEAMEACIKDAQRYRHAREQMSPKRLYDIWAEAMTADDIDADMDAAISQEAK